jgi:hypothetical protein
MPGASSASYSGNLERCTSIANLQLKACVRFTSVR